MTLPINSHKQSASPTSQPNNDSPPGSFNSGAAQSSPRSSHQPTKKDSIASSVIITTATTTATTTITAATVATIVTTTTTPTTINKEPLILIEKSENLEPQQNQDTLSRCSDSSLPTDLNRSISHDSGKDRKESRGSDRSKKKSAWYNVLYPTYKSRSEDFKKNFKDVPPEERLIVDYSCAVQRDILVHGRLYVSQNYLCFYANIFRWETTVVIKWKDVTAITKEKTALVIPNAILICTDSEKHFFTSFGSRDKAYMMLFRIWQNALLDRPMPMQEMWHYVHSSYGEELGLTSDDDDYNYIPPSGAEDDKICPSSAKLPLDSEDVVNLSQSLPDGGRLSSTSESTSKSPCYNGNPLIEDQFDAMPNPNRADTELPTDLTDSSESELDQIEDPTSVKCIQPHEGRIIVKAVLSIPIDQLFTLLFTNSKFFLEFHALRRTTDIKLSPWEQNNETGTKIRTLSMVVAVTHPLGPKSSNVIETQVMHSCSKPGHLYSIDSEIVNTGIPYADSFYISVHFCLTRLSEGETSMLAYAKINYKKSVWGFVKNVIEKNTWAGLEDFYDSYIKTLRSECEEIVKGRKGRRRRRGAGPNPVSLLPQDELALSLKSPMFRAASTGRDGEKGNSALAYFVLLVLIVLVLLNLILYYKLWSLEEWAHASRSTISHLDLEVLRNPPSSHEDWLKLLQHQENLHRSQLDKWQKVVQSAVQLLKRAEETLNELQVMIRTPAPETIMSVLNTKKKEEL